MRGRRPRRYLPPALLALLLLLGLTGTVPGTAEGGPPAKAPATLSVTVAGETHVTGRGSAPLQVRDDRQARPLAAHDASGDTPAAMAWGTVHRGGGVWSPSGAAPATLLLVAPGRGPPR